MESRIYTRATQLETGQFVCAPIKLPSSITIRYGVHHNIDWVNCFVAHIDDMICFLGFCNSGDDQQCYTDLVQLFPGALLVQDNDGASRLCQKIFDRSTQHKLSMLLVGTAFQTLVWTKLLHFGTGAKMSYREFAQFMGHPRAIRAAASAIGRNNVAYLVPCHRIIKSNGNVHKYRWGTTFKQQLLDNEQR